VDNIKTDLEEIECRNMHLDRLYGLVVRVSGYGSRDPCSIPGATRFSEK
jgi:hypothetical protein